MNIFLFGLLMVLGCVSLTWGSLALFAAGSSVLALFVIVLGVFMMWKLA